MTADGEQNSGVSPIQQATTISTVGGVDPFPLRIAWIDPLPNDAEDDAEDDADRPAPPGGYQAGTERGSSDVADGPDPYRR